MNVFHENRGDGKGPHCTFYHYERQGSMAHYHLNFFYFRLPDRPTAWPKKHWFFLPRYDPFILAAGYDLLIPLTVIFAGTQLGHLSSFSNPFATIIASNAAGVNWSDGLTERIIMFSLSTIITIWYL